MWTLRVSVAAVVALSLSSTLDTADEGREQGLRLTTWGTWRVAAGLARSATP